MTRHREIMWEFHTKNFQVIATIEPSQDLDLSWDDDGETVEKLENGEYVAFDTIVTVYCNGARVGWDSLCQSIYADPREFFTAHRDADPMNRNCTIMRAAKGNNLVICHYFPSMVQEAIANTRATMAARPKLRA